VDVQVTGTESLWIPVKCLKPTGTSPAPSKPSVDVKAPAGVTGEDAEIAKVWAEIQAVDADIWARLQKLEPQVKELSARQPLSRNDVNLLAKRQTDVLDKCGAIQARLDKLAGPAAKVRKLAEKAEALAKKIDSNASLSKQISKDVELLKEEDKLAAQLQTMLASQDKRMATLAKQLGVDLGECEDDNLYTLVEEKQKKVISDAKSLLARLNKLGGGGVDGEAVEAKQMKVLQGLYELEKRIAKLDGKGDSSALEKKTEAAQKKLLAGLYALEKRIAKLDGKGESSGLEAKVETAQLKVLSGLRALEKRISKLDGKETTDLQKATEVYDKVLSKAKALDSRVAKLEGGKKAKVVPVSSGDSAFPEFLQMENSCGKISGYVHRTGPKGTGYYLENPKSANVKNIMKTLSKKYDNMISRAKEMLSGSSVSKPEDSEKSLQDLSARFDKIEERLRKIEPKIRSLGK